MSRRSILINIEFQTFQAHVEGGVEQRPYAGICISVSQRKTQKPWSLHLKKSGRAQSTVLSGSVKLQVRASLDGVYLG